MQWPGTELEESPLFTDVRQTTIWRRPDLSADEYVSHLATISAYLQLPGPIRERVLTEIREVLPDRVEIDSDITLHLARLA